MRHIHRRRDLSRAVRLRDHTFLVVGRFCYLVLDLVLADVFETLLGTFKSLLQNLDGSLELACLVVRRPGSILQ